MKAFAVVLLGLAISAPAMAGPYVESKHEFKGTDEDFSKQVHQQDDFHWFYVFQQQEKDFQGEEGKKERHPRETKTKQIWEINVQQEISKIHTRETKTKQIWGFHLQQEISKIILSKINIQHKVFETQQGLEEKENNRRIETKNRVTF